MTLPGRAAMYLLNFVVRIFMQLLQIQVNAYTDSAWKWKACYVTAAFCKHLANIVYETQGKPFPRLEISRTGLSAFTFPFLGGEFHFGT